MFRALIAASAALVALGAYPFVPQANAAEGDQTIRVQDGKLRCLLTSNYEGRGRATAILRKSSNHAVDRVKLRKL